MIEFKSGLFKNIALNEWRDPIEDPPTESGRYLCALSYCTFLTVEYSAKHKKWNVYDHNTEEEAAEHTFMPQAWMPMFPTPSTESEEVEIDWRKEE